MSEMKVNMTKSELKTLKVIMDLLRPWEPFDEPGYSDITVFDIAKKLGESTNIVRGYIGSLVKKGFIEVENYKLDYGDLLLFILLKKQETS